MNYFFSAFSLQCYRVLGIAPTKMVSEKSYNAHVHVQCMFLWVSLHMSQVVHQVRGYPGFCRMKWLEWVFLLPIEWDSSPSHHRVNPSIKSTCTHLFTWVEEVQLWELSVMPKNTTHCLWPRIQPDPETSAPTMKAQHLQQVWIQ